MADIELTARAFWTDTEGGTHAIGFAASEDPEDGYVVFEGKPGAARKTIMVEISDEIFASDDAIEDLTFTDTGFTLSLTARAAPKLGMVREVLVRVSPDDTDGQAALTLLKSLLD